MDSSMTSDRTRIREWACSSLKPSDLRRETNFRVSKWWSRGSAGVLAKLRVGCWGRRDLRCRFWRSERKEERKLGLFGKDKV